MAGSQTARKDAPTLGIGPEDERLHPASPDLEWWSESFDFDWCDAAGARGGHCRIGLHPNQDRMWLQLHVIARGEWIALEESRLPLPRFDGEQLAYDGFGLSLSWRPRQPLRRGQLRLRGSGRALAGPRAGALLPLEVDLAIESRGEPFTRGASQVSDGADGRFDAGRFAQPTAVSGRLCCGAASEAFEGFGGRERAWGPRSRGHEWQALHLPVPPYGLEVAVADVPNAGRFCSGHAQREGAVAVKDVDLRVEFRDRTRPVGGTLRARLAGGDAIDGRIEIVSSAELDVSHLRTTAQQAVCGRALVRFTPRRRGWRRPRPTPGWLEWHRFPE